MLQKQQWTLLPAALVTELQQLRLSPLGVIPQHDRRPRTIADYTFFHVNQDTVPLGPPEAMQFGRSLRRLLTKILYADPRFGPVYLCKIDIADGFYRIWLLPCDIPKLGVLFPTNSGEPPLIGFPLTLPMGWVESPPLFLGRHRNCRRSGQPTFHYRPLSAAAPPGAGFGDGPNHPGSRRLAPALPHAHGRSGSPPFPTPWILPSSDSLGVHRCLRR